MKGNFLFWMVAFLMIINIEIRAQARVDRPFPLAIPTSSQEINLKNTFDSETEFHSPSPDELNTHALLDIAPLIPLEPQFPLELTQANRQFLIENPERLKKAKRSLQDDLEKHSFPWLTIITLLGGGGIGWIIYLMRDRWPKRSFKVMTPFSSPQQIEQALHKCSLESSQTPVYYAELASILLEALQIRLGWKTTGLTTNELAQAMKKQSDLSSQQTTEVLSILTEIDQIKFAGKKPSQTEATQIFEEIQKFIRLLLTTKSF